MIARRGRAALRGSPAGARLIEYDKSEKKKKKRQVEWVKLRM